MNIKTNRFFFKKAKKGWTIMKRRVDGYVLFSTCGWHHGRKHGSKSISSTDGVEIIPCGSIRRNSNYKQFIYRQDENIINSQKQGFIGI